MRVKCVDCGEEADSVGRNGHYMCSKCKGTLCEACNEVHDCDKLKITIVDFKKMLPSDIEVLIHCHCIPSIHPRIDAPAVANAMKRFLDNGLIRKYQGKEEGIFTTTARGAAHIDQLCNTPWPVQKWVDKDGCILNN